MTTDDPKMNERMFLLQRLTSQKDALLRATQEIEDLRFQYISAGKSDPNGNFEKEVWKRLLLIISVISELNSYSDRTSNKMTVTFITFLTQLQGLHWIMDSDFMRLVSMLANGIQIHWDVKKGPMVNFKDLSIFKNMFGSTHG
jgi:hypothetical protein